MLVNEKLISKYFSIYRTVLIISCDTEKPLPGVLSTTQNMEVVNIKMVSDIDFILENDE
jgi:hypothetical protein